jgi:hypothetical protein
MDDRVSKILVPNNFSTKAHSRRGRREPRVRWFHWFRESLQFHYSNSKITNRSSKWFRESLQFHYSNSKITNRSSKLLLLDFNCCWFFLMIDYSSYLKSRGLLICKQTLEILPSGMDACHPALPGKSTLGCIQVAWTSMLALLCNISRGDICLLKNTH